MKYLAMVLLAFLAASACGSSPDRSQKVPAASSTTAPNLGLQTKQTFDRPNQGVGLDGNTTAHKPDSTAASKPTPTTRPGKRPARPTPGPDYEDPRRIQAGIGYEEMVRRFGPPSIKITAHSGRSTLSYSKRPTLVQVEVQDGRVISVTETRSE